VLQLVATMHRRYAASPALEELYAGPCRATTRRGWVWTFPVSCSY